MERFLTDLGQMAVFRNYSGFDLRVSNFLFSSRSKKWAPGSSQNDRRSVPNDPQVIAKWPPGHGKMIPRSRRNDPLGHGKMTPGSRQNDPKVIVQYSQKQIWYALRWSQEHFSKTSYSVTSRIISSSVYGTSVTLGGVILTSPHHQLKKVSK